MRTIFSSRKNHYLKTVSFFLIVVALVAAMVSCNGGPTPAPKYDLTMAVNPSSGGAAVDVTGASPYESGTVVDIQATPAASYTFVKWTSPAGTASFANPNAATTNFTMPAQNTTVTAHFVGPLDHFKCYWTDEATAPYPDKAVYLEDQFVALNATVELADLFCNPTDKLHDDVPTPMFNPDHHFIVYHLSYEEEPQTRYVEVDNQFGLQELMVQGPVALAVPTQKLEPGSHEPPLRLDHSLLYEDIGGPPVGADVVLNDQFTGEPDALVLEPIYLANPVRKTHGTEVTEIVDPDTHLLFYFIETEDAPSLTQVQVVNQFGEETFHVRTPSFLAVPSTKTDLPPPPPLDHFKCYNLLVPVEAIPNEVHLKDQFSDFWASVTYGTQFCNNVLKVHEGVPTEPWYPMNHLMLFDIDHTEELPDWQVVVYNQFGQQQLNVGRPVKLAVPTQKLDPGPHPPPIDLDHFLLYEALGDPIGVPVDLVDQFYPEPNVVVLEPVFFANPVEKTHEGVTPILNQWAHLVFYQIYGAPSIIDVIASNQFIEYQFLLLDAFYLAVPTEKLYYQELPAG